MMRTRMTTLAISLVLLLSISIGGAAQTTPPENMVYLPVAVTGAKNAYVTGLKKENFQLKEDGKDQALLSVSEAGAEPFEINIILALSVLQKGRSDSTSLKVREAVEEFRKAGHEENRYTVEELPFGSNGVFDAMSRHIRGLSEMRNPRKALVVVTDGFDSPGGDPGRALQEYAKGKDVPVYIFYSPLPSTGQEEAILGDTGAGEIDRINAGRQIHLDAGAVYQDLAGFTGGRLYQADADTQLLGNLKTLAAELDNQYLLGFVSTNPARDNKWRKLEVKIVPPAGQRDLKAKIKERYFVAK